MNRKTTFVSTLVAALLVSAVANADILYSNAWDGSGNLYSTQNDTNGFGNFATSYGYFNTGREEWKVTDLHFVGGYFNPPQQGVIAGFTVNFFQDDGANGIGAFLGSSYVTSFTETFLSAPGGFPCYQYDMDVNPLIVSGEAWVSIVPDLGFPPQWGWGGGVDANPLALGYQDFFGDRSRLPQSLNFELTGNVTPEPASMVALSVGALALLRRKRK